MKGYWTRIQFQIQPVGCCSAAVSGYQEAGAIGTWAWHMQQVEVRQHQQNRIMANSPAQPGEMRLTCPITLYWKANKWPQSQLSCQISNINVNDKQSNSDINPIHDGSYGEATAGKWLSFSFWKATPSTPNQTCPTPCPHYYISEKPPSNFCIVATTKFLFDLTITTVIVNTTN